MKKDKSPSDFRKILNSIAHHYDTRRVFDGFTILSACALSMGTREAEYMEEIKRWKKEDLIEFSKAQAALVMEMESRPFEDVLGNYYMEFALSTKGQQWNGEFHTPQCICDLMAQLILTKDNIPAEGPITVSEPACGAGAMILAQANALPRQDIRRLRVTAIDVNKTACDMCFINTTLWGIPTRIIHGNTLSMKFYAAWSNIHFIMPWLPLTLRVKSPEAKEQGQPPKPEEIKEIKIQLGQQELAFA